MQIKRTFSRRQPSQIDEFINYLSFQDTLGHNDWAQKIMDNDQLKHYFTDLHLYITSRNVYYCKGYETLNDGIYILLKGSIRYVLENMNEKEKMKKSKLSNMRGMNAGIIINDVWSVFTCFSKNCTANIQSYLLKITEEQAILSRNQLYINQYISQDHQKIYDFYSEQRVFQVDMRLHYNFIFQRYNFRQVVELTTPAIINQGRCKLKMGVNKTNQFDKFGVLLPNLKYLVTSAQLQLMVIKQNQSISYFFQPVFQQPNKVGYKSISSVNLIENSKTVNHSPKMSDHNISRNLHRNQSKQFLKVFKDSQPYTIISKFLCEKSLNFAKYYNKINLTKKKRENRYRQPLILFDIANQKSKLDTPKFINSKQNNKKLSQMKYLNGHKFSSQSQSSHQSIFKCRLFPTSCQSKLKKYRQNMTELQSKTDNLNKIEQVNKILIKE